ncbi:cell wall-active antibiotics response protein [Alkaliphilus serpentinus]|uniref:Cell wall-active antibiotics response protein n=1 Tax=Alkaliphilus serpentinus TaxID=1482731 RepID=A0A833M8H0_9FIRM|nr:cell wall-active antibiotics response protein [Alkaliphilus serpentinus]KAB3525678.1 cell wall-active antibiotics response protein [Alkaliphilus serpentinus]
MFRSRWIFGILIIILGVTFLLNNLDITNFDVSQLISIYWPVILILIGLNLVTNIDSKGEIVSGIIIAFLGVVFLGRNTGLFDIDLSIFWKLFWPSIIIIAGISLMTGKHNVGKSNFAILGGIEKKREPWALESGSYTAFMGGVELDLTIADIPEGETILDLTAIMGGIDIIVPRDITVHCQGTVILGGLELLDKSTGGIISSTKAERVLDGPTNKTIKIYSRAIMGGIDVKSR